MLKKEQVLKYINDNIHVTTFEICEHFNVSESTTRRVLTQLEESKAIGRYHGGAFSIKQDYSTKIALRMDVNTLTKIKIAQEAAESVMNGSTIILSSGTTVSYMCRFISHKDVTVITNSMLVLDELKCHRNIKLIILGGLYNNDEAEIGGVLSNSNLSYLRADKLFMGASSFSEKYGFINRNDSLELFRSCIQSCDETSVLVDSSKYNKGGSAIAATPDQIKNLYTDALLPPDAVKSFTNKGIHVIMV